jgi:hypothetical protein
MKPLTGHPWLDYSANISSATYITTTDGSQIPDSTSVANSIACCVQPHTSREMIQWARDTGKRVSLGIFDPAALPSIAKDAILTITDPGGTARTYRAMGPSRNASGVGVLTECDLEETS